MFSTCCLHSDLIVWSLLPMTAAFDPREDKWHATENSHSQHCSATRHPRLYSHWDFSAAVAVVVAVASAVLTSNPHCCCCSCPDHRETRMYCL